MTLVYLYILILGIIAVGLLVLRTRMRKRTFGRFMVAFLMWIFWLVFLILLGYEIGYGAGQRGVSILHLLHISHS